MSMLDPPTLRRLPSPSGLTTRDARPEDNAALIAMELESPLVLGDREATFDRSPDFFSRNRLQAEHRIIVGEMEGRIVGVEAIALHSPVLRGLPRRLGYVHHGRIHPSAQRRGVAGAIAAVVLGWAREQGAEGAYWLISPTNAPSIAFGGRGGGRWPVDVTFRDYDLSAFVQAADGADVVAVPPGRLAEAADLVNASHAGQDLFEPLSAASLAARLSRDAQYTPADLRCVISGGRIAAVAGFWDEGASMQMIERDRVNGAVHRSRSAAVIDWGCAPGEQAAFAAVLRSFAARAAAVGRDALSLCEPFPGAMPDIGLPSSTWALSLFTPTIEPSPADEIRGLFADLVYL